MHIDRISSFSRKRFWAGVLLAQIILFFILSRIEFFINILSDFFEFKKGFHQKIFSYFSFSCGDIIYLSLALFVIWNIFLLFSKHKRSSSLKTLLITLNVFYFVYQIFWGMLYFQRPMIDSLPKDEPVLYESKKLSLYFLKECINLRKCLTENKNGIFQIKNIKQIEKDIIESQRKLPKLLIDKQTTTIISIKASLFRKMMNYTGIFGYFNPFTSEAQYNPELPQTSIPFTLAHETAHQLGIAREQEANFIGYLIAVNSENKEIKYSAYFFALRSLLNDIQEKDPEFVKQMLGRYSPEMIRDRSFEKAFFKRHSGVIDDFFAFTNDLFLKSNQQEGAITYSYFTDLLLRYERIKN